MALEVTHRSSSRPTGWSYASPDLNCLLSGRLVTSDAQGASLEGAQFQLDEGGLYIEHHSLVSITTTPTGQTLASLNTGAPILTILVPLLPPSTSPSPSSSPAPSTTSTSTTAATTVTLHAPLLTPSDLATIESSPLYSSTFHLLLDGPSFLPPQFDPATASAAPATPQVSALGTSSTSAGAGNLLNSPTIQRALLSPLLSPQRRAHSQGSDMSVPPLSLGLSRGRAPSITGARSSTSGNGISGSPSAVRSSSRPSSRPPTGLDALLPPPNSRPSLDAVLGSSVTSRAKKTAEEIMALRRSHDAYVKRVKAELEVLNARVSNATNATVREGGGLVVKGFGAGGDAPSKSKSPVPKDRRTESLSREQSRERSVERGTSEERGRARAAGGSKKDEDVSREMRESDKREQEERGRSRSRARGRGDGSTRAESKTGKAVKEVVQKAAAAGYATSSPKISATKSPAVKPQQGDAIPASIDDCEGGEDDSAPATPASGSPSRSPSAPAVPSQSIPSSSTEQHSGVVSPMSFVPSSHALVNIPEEEELSLPPSEAGDAADGRDGEGEKKLNGKREVDGDSEDEEEHETPFEMDEDIDVDDLALGPSNTSLAGEFDDVPPAPPEPQQQAQHTTSQSFRPGSMARTSSLSASYNALLNSHASLATRRTAPSASKSPALPPSRSPLPSSSTSFASLVDSIGSTPPDASHPTSTTAREDAQTTLAFIPRPDAKEARRGEEKIREVLAMDAPSHRRPLPNKRAGRNRKSSGDGGEFELDDDESEPEEDRTARMAVGSVPISIGFARPTTSTFLPPSGERELQRKTSVPGKEGMFVPPLLRPGDKRVVQPSALVGSVGASGQARRRSIGFVGPEEGSKAAQQSSKPPPAPAAIPASSRPPSNPSSSSALSSSLARSLLSPPPGGVRSFSQVAEEEELEEEEASTPGSKREEDEEDEDFVPPHEFVMRGRRDEEMLSRSVSSY